jgi:Secretion system C-terminal sorting domain
MKIFTKIFVVTFFMLSIFTAKANAKKNVYNAPPCTVSDTITQTTCDSIWWHGIKYTTSGLYTDTLLSTGGCDSIVTLHLTVNYSTTSTTNISICSASLPYSWNGNNYTIGGTYLVHLTSATNCDSTATLNLAVVANPTVNISGGSAFCGSPATTTLTSTVNNLTTGATAYLWRYLPYNANSWQVVSSDTNINVSVILPVQYQLMITVSGCGTYLSNVQSVIPLTPPTVTLLPNPAVSICSGNTVSFTATGNTTDKNIFEFFNGTTSLQKDTTSTYTTPILTTANSGNEYKVSATNAAIFDGNIDENFWGLPVATALGGAAPSFGIGHELNALYVRADANNFYFAIAGAVQNHNRIMLFIDSKTGGYNNGDFGRAGLLNNAIKNFNSGTVFDKGFEADYCLGIGTDATNSNYYFDLYTLSGSANNVATGGPLNYVGTPTSPVAGYSIGANPVNGMQTKGFEIAIPKSAISYTGGDIQVMAMYSGDNGFLSNQFLTQANLGAGSYGNISIFFDGAAPNPISIPANISNACNTTSAITIVTVKPTSTSTSTTSACDSLWWNGTKYTTSGTYTFSATNSVGCDSTATLVLTINHPTTSTTILSACDSLVWNGTTYFTSGTYTYNTINATNCDSVATLNVTINATPAIPALTGVATHINAPELSVVNSCAIVANTVSYLWTYSGTGATIVGNGSDTVKVDYAANATDGNLCVQAIGLGGCANAATCAPITIILLPVTLTAYRLQLTENATRNEKRVTNYWTTATEVNASHFNIQRSVNAKDFETIGSVAAKGTGNYEYIDNRLPFTVGTLYYRLQMVDKDGRIEYSIIKRVTLNEKQETSSLVLYPNPATSLVNISVADGKELFIINYLGQTIKHYNNITQQQTLNTQQMPKGIYTVKVVLNNGTIQTEKLIVE